MLELSKFSTTLPVNRCGNLIGRMTASFSASFAPSRPATSSHLTSGFSITIAPTQVTESSQPWNVWALHSVHNYSNDIQCIHSISNWLCYIPAHSVWIKLKYNAQNSTDEHWTVIENLTILKHYYSKAKCRASAYKCRASAYSQALNTLWVSYYKKI